MVMHVSTSPICSPTTEDAKLEAMVSAIMMLVGGLSDSERASVLRRLNEKLRPIPVPRAGDVLSAVVDLLPKERSWTVREVKAKIEASDPSVSEKEVYNAIAYLTRKQHIKRLGYGRYEIAGVSFVSADDLGGQPSNTEGDLDD